MSVDTELLARAVKLRPGAVDALLQSQAEGVYRIAYALTGRWDAGRSIARFVLNRSVRILPNWQTSDEAENWFRRYTVIRSRESSKSVSAKKDVLVEQALMPDSTYIAFVSALRQLDAQQREAFLLRYGEKLNGRYSALAMDCSTEAADNHLRAAEQTLRMVAGGDYEALASKLVDAYKHLTPDGQQLRPTVNGIVFRKVRVRRWLRWTMWLVGLSAMAALAWGAWKVIQVVQT